MKQSTTEIYLLKLNVLSVEVGKISRTQANKYGSIWFQKKQFKEQCNHRDNYFHIRIVKQQAKTDSTFFYLSRVFNSIKTFFRIWTVYSFVVVLTTGSNLFYPDLPQGPILHPILTLVFINDFVLTCEKSIQSYCMQMIHILPPRAMLMIP